MRFVEIVVLAGGTGGARFLRGVRAAAPGATITAVVIDPAAPPDVADPEGNGLEAGDRFTVTDSTGEELLALVQA